jgi:hypothetical protein
MSLQLAANHLAAHGRGPDTTLVHMSRDEVKGLNDLAMAHGGQLTINPQTGLPEAGFLSSLLPMIGGAALSAMGMPPMMASLIMGGVTGVASGSLSKGLMAGLGAYGGAGLMGGFMGAGNSAIAEGATNAAIQSGAHTAGAAEAAFGSHGFGNAALQSPAVAASSPFTSAFEGVKGLGSEAGRDAFMSNIGGGKGLMKYGMAAAAPVLAAPETSTKQPEIKTDTDPGQRYTYSPGRTDVTGLDPSGREQTYFQPKFTPISQPQAKNIYGYAGGGPIEAMSDANAVGANTGYPMADINKGAYATPYQTPISRNVLQGVSDTGVNPMTGEMNFADGGEVAVPDKYSYDPLTQMFKKIEAMPSDNQVKTNQPAEPLPVGGGYSSNQGNQTPGTRALPTAMVEGGGKITPMAVPSLALSKVGDAVTNGLGYLAFKMSKPNPNPQNVQVSEGLTFNESPNFTQVESTLGDTQAKADANNAQQAQAISAALSALQGVGPSSSGLSAGFGAPGATSGNAGAMGFGPAGMATQSIGGIGAGGATGGGATSGGGGGGGGAPGAPGLGVNSGGGFGVTGPGGTAGVGGTAGAASGAANGGLMAAYAAGGSHLGDYSDGGRLLRGPGDGVSDSIPAMIGKKQPARLADGEFVVPARIVSELGNGSTEAGARKLYAMMDRIQKARGKTVGKGRVAKNSRAERFLPA